jgi:alkanesulfonate monooxygenase SsuD/methylene tetrahydromethanopterin reductase-like flavin-dependent oxidoreductase (luciferase family)
MKIGIGIPNSIPGTEGTLLVEWAKRADALGFSALSTVGRVAYPSFEELTTLAAAAGATERIGLLTGVLLEPTREPVLLAKSAASLDQLSAGRFILGLAVGARPDDFEVSGTDFHRRGRRMDADLELMHMAWRGEPLAGSPHPLTPRPVNGERVPIVIGGRSDAAVARTVRWGIGWMAGGGGPDFAVPMYERVTSAWQQAGREGKPQLLALHYFALGDDIEAGHRYITHYYGGFGERIWPGVAKDPEAVQSAVQRFEEIGTDELFLWPTIASLDQVELLARVAL